MVCVRSSDNEPLEWAGAGEGEGEGPGRRRSRRAAAPPQSDTEPSTPPKVFTATIPAPPHPLSILCSFVSRSFKKTSYHWSPFRIGLISFE